MSIPIVRVLVLNWNGLEHLEGCFTSLISGCQREDVEFVLLDNGSTDSSIQFIRERFSNDKRVVIEPLNANYGWSGGNNKGIISSMERGVKYIFLLNNDTAIVPGCIETLIEMCELDPKIGGVAPKMVLYDQPWIINSVGLECSIIGSAWDRGLGRADSEKWNEVVEVVGICGGAMWLRTDVLRKTNLFPEEFEIYLDDLDLCLQIWDAGYRICTCPHAIVLHKFSATWGGSVEKKRRKYYLNTRNRFWLVERNFPLSSILPILFWIKIGEIKAIGDSVERGEFWRLWEHLRAWKSALGYIPNAWNYRRTQKIRCCGMPHLPAYWHLIRTKPLFCPEIELPRHGWYRPRMYYGEKIYPMSQKAIIDHKGGQLHFLCGTIYPQLGTVEVEVKIDGGEIIGFIQTEKFAEVNLNLPTCKVILESKKVFYSEQTGENFDVGAWIKIGRDGNNEFNFWDEM